MNERIKELRKTLNWTMARFGAAVGLKKASVSSIENGRNNVSEQLLNNICKTSFDGKYVSENWLRTGNGPMFLELDKDGRIDAFVKDVSQDGEDSVRRRVLESLSTLSNGEWQTLWKIFQGIAQKN